MCWVGFSYKPRSGLEEIHQHRRRREKSKGSGVTPEGNGGLTLKDKALQLKQITNGLRSAGGGKRLKRHDLDTNYWQGGRGLMKVASVKKEGRSSLG